MTSRQPPTSRGSVYLPVLGTAMLVTVIGLAALLGARVQRQAAAAEGDLSVARSNARTAVELAMLTVQQDPSWRTLGTNWVTERALDDGTISIEARDPLDGDLANNATDPVELTGIGTSGAARYSVRVVMDATGGLNEPSPAFVAGGAITITGTDVRGDGLLAANGDVVASGASINLDVETAATASGDTYLGTVTEGVAPWGMPGSIAFAAPYLNAGTEIHMRELESDAPNGLVNGSFESGMSPWEPMDRNATLQLDPGASEGIACVRVTDRTAEDATPGQDLSEVLPREVFGLEASAWVRVASGTADVQLALRVQTNKKYTEYGPIVEVGTEWTKVTWVWDWSHASRLRLAELHIVTPGSTVDLWVDDFWLAGSGEIISRTLSDIVLAPTANPFGELNVNGIYHIDCENLPLTIRNCRIVGTLVLEQVGPGTIIEESVVWEPAAPGQPILIVPTGSVTIATRDVPLSESALFVNFNPAGVPYPWSGGGVEDSDSADVYESRLQGWIHIGGSLSISSRPVMTAVIQVAGSVTCTAARLELDVDADAAVAAAGGVPTRLELVAGSWERVVTP